MLVFHVSASGKPFWRIGKYSTLAKQCPTTSIKFAQVKYMLYVTGDGAFGADELSQAPNPEHAQKSLFE